MVEVRFWKRDILREVYVLPEGSPSYGAVVVMSEAELTKDINAIGGFVRRFSVIFPVLLVAKLLMV
ncbi:MAG: hypothetical protein L7R83_04095 [Candidatus Poseidonia sp.]|nr:hypothetical protein [Poseidonia sp.]